MKRSKNRIHKIRKILRATYPDVKTQLHYRNPFELLVATILSAQCTDKQVNSVTKTLFKELTTPYDFANASLGDIENLIRPTGYFRNKAKSIQNCSKQLIETYNGEVPQTLEQLVKLTGVGRKTANVVLGAAFKTPGIVVDTHVARISKRLGLTDNRYPAKIEIDLMEVIPKRDWSDFSLHLIYFGSLIQRTVHGFETLQHFLSTKSPYDKCLCDINLRPGCYNRSIVLKCLERADILKLNEEELARFRSRFGIPIGDDEVAKAPFYRPPEDSPEMCSAEVLPC